jgi:hypothetical protein
MEENAMPKRLLKGRLYSNRRKGRPRMRWLDDGESDLKKMEVKGWQEKMRDREQWRRPRLNHGCSAEWQAGWLVFMSWLRWLHASFIETKPEFSPRKTGYVCL